VRLTRRCSQQPLALPFTLAVGDSLLPGFGDAALPRLWLSLVVRCSMSKLRKIAGCVILIAVLVLVAYPVVHGSREKAQLEMRLHDAKQIGIAYNLYLDDTASRDQIALTDLRKHLPVGFRLDRYELLPHGSNSTKPWDTAFVREVTPDEARIRVVVYMDGHVEARRE